MSKGPLCVVGVASGGECFAVRGGEPGRARCRREAEYGAAAGAQDARQLLLRCAPYGRLAAVLFVRIVGYWIE